MLFAFSAGSRPTYILGHAYSHGVWFYFPALFILKSPLAFLLLLLLALVIAILLKRRQGGHLQRYPAAWNFTGVLYGSRSRSLWPRVC